MKRKEKTWNPAVYMWQILRLHEDLNRKGNPHSKNDYWPSTKLNATTKLKICYICRGRTETTHDDNNAGNTSYSAQRTDTVSIM